MVLNKELVRALNHSLALMLAGTLAAFFWIYFRVPQSNLMMVSGAFLITGILYDVASFENRLRVTLKILLAAGTLQFLIGVCREEKFLLLLVPTAFVFWMFATIKSRLSSSTALMIGCLSLTAPPGFYPAATRFLDFFYTGAAVMIVTSLVHIVHYQDRYELELPGAYTPVQSLRAALIFGIGIYLMEALWLPQGIWIIYTVAMVYAAVARGQDIFFLAKNRILSTVLGLFLCYLYLNCFVFFDYRMSYLLPLFGGLAFFFLYYNRNYFAFTTMFIMTFSLYLDINVGDAGTVHIWQCVHMVMLEHLILLS